MIVTCRSVGALRTNCYILYQPDRDDAVVIDPGDDAPEILRALQGRRVSAVLLTHGHFDHTGALNEIGKNAEIIIGEADAPMLQDSQLSVANLADDRRTRPAATRTCGEGDVITAAGLHIEVLATPGHTPGGVCYLCEHTLFSGDTLFRAGYGRTDLPGGDMNALRQSLKRLLAMRNDLRVCPGHDDETSILREAGLRA